MKKPLAVVLTLVVVVIAVAAAIGVMSKQGDTKDSAATSASNPDNSMTGMNMSKDATATPTADSEAVTTNSVEISDYKFLPNAITVKVGTTVTWTNKDSVKHNIVADTAGDGAPNGPLFGRGETYSYTFTKAGTYAYHCDPHPYMKATVVVTE